MKRIILLLIGMIFILSAEAQNKFTYPLEIGKVGISNGQITLFGSTSGSNIIKSNVIAGSAIQFILPSTNGSANYFLKTDGSGTTSWSMIPQSSVTALSDSLTTKAPKASPTFTGVPKIGSDAIATRQNINDSLDAYIADAPDLDDALLFDSTTDTLSTKAYARSVGGGTGDGVPMSRYAIDTTGRYNILSFGATNGGLVEDATAIQAAINAASTYGGTPDKPYGGWPIYIPSGTVVIPAGDWYITKPDTLKSYVNIEIAQGARFFFPDDYTGAMWVSPYNTHLQKCYVSGGYYSNPTQSWDYLRLTSNDNLYPVVSNVFRDAYIDSCNIGINISTTGSGWINDNLFENLSIWRPITGIKTRQGAGSYGVDGNRFNNIAVQSVDNTTFAIDSLSGDYNSFSNLMCWDFDYATQHTVVIGPTGENNTFVGGFISPIGTEQSFHDYGSKNIILSGGGVLTELQQPVTIWRSNDTYSNLLTISKHGASGTSSSPSGTTAIVLNSHATSLGTTSTNYSARIFSRNEETTDYGSWLYMQTHGVADDATTGGYNYGITITPSGDVRLGRRLVQPQRTGALTDGAPTDAEIDSITGETPSSAGAGWKVVIKDNNGTGLLYLIESDGTSWFYLVMTKAL